MRPVASSRPRAAPARGKPWTFVNPNALAVDEPRRS
jgi:hypothetical protein